MLAPLLLLLTPVSPSNTEKGDLECIKGNYQGSLKSPGASAVPLLGLCR